ncbi:hypothetical protein CTI12_AA259360 [Artemisia annua]|uniref:Zinc finger, CCHC-type n=1 Tax=Artemisia annua TaxID=35608 RepID=A0A2U1NJD8_ARTAN|nr:hypothetical protein CTI12_AA259360 [Artemisia annua]
MIPNNLAQYLQPQQAHLAAAVQAQPVQQMLQPAQYVQQAQSFVQQVRHAIMSYSYAYDSQPMGLLLECVCRISIVRLKSSQREEEAKTSFFVRSRTEEENRSDVVLSDMGQQRILISGCKRISDITYRQLRIILSAEDKENYLEHPIPVAPVATPGHPVLPEAMAAHTSWVKGSKDIAAFMLMTIFLEIQQNLTHLGAYDMLQESKSMFAQQAE